MGRRDDGGARIYTNRPSATYLLLNLYPSFLRAGRRRDDVPLWDLLPTQEDPKSSSKTLMAEQIISVIVEGEGGLGGGGISGSVIAQGYAPSLDR